MAYNFDSGFLGGNRRETPQTAATSSPLHRMLAREAFLRGYQEVMGTQAQGQKGSSPRAKLPGNARDQQANQAGGHAYSPTTGPQQQEGAGGGGGLGGLYSAYLQDSLSGQGGIPANLYNDALMRGLTGLNAQAQSGGANLASNLGARGLLHSGLMGSGLASIETGRLGALGDLSSNLENANLAAVRSAQGQAAGLYQADQQGAANRALQETMQRRQIEASEPEWWEPFASLAGAFTQWQGRPRAAAVPALNPITAAPVAAAAPLAAYDMTKDPDYPYLQNPAWSNWGGWR